MDAETILTIISTIKTVAEVTNTLIEENKGNIKIDLDQQIALQKSIRDLVKTRIKITDEYLTKSEENQN
jgi:hypothetical protein